VIKSPLHFISFSFQGATTLNLLDPPANASTDQYKWGHLAMTYTCIAVLVILGDDLSRLDRRAIVDGVASVQREDGSFSASVQGKLFILASHNHSKTPPLSF
jgi:hypothetical protein